MNRLSGSILMATGTACLVALNLSRSFGPRTWWAYLLTGAEVLLGAYFVLLPTRTRGAPQPRDTGDGDHVVGP